MASNPYMTKANKLKRDNGEEFDSKTSSYMEKANAIKNSRTVTPILPPTIETTPKKSGFLSNLGNSFTQGVGKSVNNPLINLADLYFKSVDKIPGIDTSSQQDWLQRMRENNQKVMIDDTNVDTTNASLPEKAAYFLAEQAPMLLPANILGKATGVTKAGQITEGLINSKLGGKLGQYAGTAAREGIENAAYGVANSTLEGNSATDTLKTGAVDFLGGAALGAGLKGVGELLPKWMKSNVPKVENKTINVVETPKAEVAASVETPKVSYAKIEQPDVIPPKIDISNAKIETPKPNTLDSDSALFKESQFKSNTMRNAEMLQQEETQKVIDNIHAMYEVKPNAESVARANTELSIDPQGVINRIKNAESLNSAEDAAAAGLVTNQLRLEAEKTGDYTKLKDWLETVQPKVTATAQSLQAVSTWKKLTPEGALMKAQQVVGKVNRDGLEAFGKDFKKVELTPDEMKFINDTMKRVEELPEGREKDLEFAKVKKVIAEKIPTTLQDKVKALQRISLLLNPKTLLARNPLGNLILGGLENVKDIPGSLVDRAVSLKTGQRTTLAPSIEGLVTQGKGLVKGTKETFEDAKLGVSTSPSAGQFDIPEAQVFKKGLLSKLEKATNVGLELGDRPFYQAAYDDYLRQQMKIGKVDKPSEAMTEKAKAYAEERTLQNVSALVKGFKGVQEGLNQISTGNKDLGLGTFALPFTKTPANILDKAIDYSPVGSIKAIRQLFQKGDFNQKKFVDRMGRSLTGSAMIMLGYDLAKDGLLTGKANKDKDVAALEKQTGKSPYAFKVGDTYRTFDWMQPAAIPLAIGADIFNEGKDKKAATNVIGEAIKSGGTTLFSQSLLQGVQRLFGGNNIMDSIGSTVSNIPTQFVPSFLKQIAQLTDDTQRDTYDPDKTQSLLNQLKVKVPGLSSSVQPKIDTLGREVKQFQGDNGLFNVLLNPGYTTKEKSTPAEKMVLDVYNDTGSKIQFPRVASNSITYKIGKDASETVQLTPKEKTELQKYIGEQTSIKFDSLAANNTFMNKSSKDKAKELQSLLTKIYNDGEEYILRGRGISEYKGK